MRKIANLAIVFLILAASGCHGKESQVIGTWSGQNGLTVKFGEDMSFTQTGVIPMTGEWKLSGQKVIVKIDKLNGVPLDESIRSMGMVPNKNDIESIKRTLSDIEYELSEDGKSLTQNVKGMPSATYKKNLPK